MAPTDTPVEPFRESFDAFYLREFPRMVSLAYAVSGSRIAAEDLAQEAMVRAHRNWSRLAAYDKPGAWVRRVTINLSHSSARRRASEIKAILRLGHTHSEIPEPAEPDEPLWAAMRALPDRQRSAVALHYLDELNIREIAAILGCAENTAKVHLHRGRAALAAAIGPTRESS